MTAKYLRATAGVIALLILVLHGTMALGVENKQRDIKVDTWVDHTSIYVGDPVTLRITFTAPEHFEVQPKGALNIEPYELLDQRREMLQNGDSYVWILYYTITSYDLEAREVPAIAFEAQFDDGVKKELSSGLVRVTMKSLLQEQAMQEVQKQKQQQAAGQKTTPQQPSAQILPQGQQPGPPQAGQLPGAQQLPGSQQAPAAPQQVKIDLKPRDIKPPLPLMHKSYWVFWALGALLALILVVLLINRIRNRLDERERKALPEPPKTPAHIIAFRRLAQLENEHYPARQAFRVYHFALSEIVREYLQNRYHFPALESTTSEIEAYIRRTYPQGLDERMVRDVLHPCDYVKFAGFTPSEDDAEALMPLAKELVERTRADRFSSSDTVPKSEVSS